VSRRSARAVHRRCGCGAQERDAALLVRPWDSRSPVSLRRDSAGVLKLGSPPQHQRRDSLLHRAACACARTCACVCPCARALRRQRSTVRSRSVVPFRQSVRRHSALASALGRRRCPSDWRDGIGCPPTCIAAARQRRRRGCPSGYTRGYSRGHTRGHTRGYSTGRRLQPVRRRGGAAQRRRRDRKGVGGGRRSGSASVRCARVGPVLCVCLCVCVCVCLCVFACLKCAVHSARWPSVRSLACLFVCVFACCGQRVVRSRRRLRARALCGAGFQAHRRHHDARHGAARPHRRNHRPFQRPLTP
jgi:hypothetical protein